MVDGGWWAVLASGLVVFNLGQALARFTSGVALAVFGLAAAMFALAGWHVHWNARRKAGEQGTVRDLGRFRLL